MIRDYNNVVTIAELQTLVERQLGTNRLIAIDGLPLSGKSTLAERLASVFGLQVLGFDDFVLPLKEWPQPIAPAFPFPFVRVREFGKALQALRREGRATWQPLNWTTLDLASERTELVARGPVIVEGCSVLSPAFSKLYDFRVFVESDRSSVLAAQAERDGASLLTPDWETLILPSVDLYMRTEPATRADVSLMGRGLA